MGSRAPRGILEYLIAGGFMWVSRPNVIGIALLSLCLAGKTVVAASFTTLPGSVRAITPDGSIVYGTADFGSGHRMFRWTSFTGMVDLDLEVSPVSVSADGSVVSGVILNVPSSEGDPVAVFRWTDSTGVVNLGQGYASGMSSDGSVIVGFQGFEGAFQGFRWTQESGRTLIPDFLGGALSSANGVSADGSVVAGYANSPFGIRSFSWTQSTGTLPLGEPAGTTNSGASAISADGSTIVGTRHDAGGSHIYRWTQATGIVDIGPGSHIPRAINADGSIIAGDYGGLTSEAFVWDEANGIRNLQSLLLDLGVDVAGWSIREVNGISGDGFTIIGMARPPGGGSNVGFIAVIPEPTSAGLLLVPMLIATTRRKRASTP